MLNIVDASRYIDAHLRAFSATSPWRNSLDQTQHLEAVMDPNMTAGLVIMSGAFLGATFVNMKRVLRSGMSVRPERPGRDMSLGAASGATLGALALVVNHFLSATP